MPPVSNLHQLLSHALKAGISASEAIMAIYRTPFDFDRKTDGSPITHADRRSNQLITDALKTTGLPIVSEESQIKPWAERKHWNEYWLVDPLDGTREFISRNGEFAVNIALMQNNMPIGGIIISPVLGKAWWGVAGQQAFTIKYLSLLGKINVEVLLKHSVPIAPKPPAETIGMAVSRSHIEPHTLRLAQQIMQKYGNVELIKKGSALKFCDLIEGRPVIYARYSQTWEWDTAAGHALLLANGGQLYHITEHQPLQYNKIELNNPGFIAFARKEDSARYFSELTF